MSGFSGFRKTLERIVSAGREDAFTDRELSDLGISRADMALLLSGKPGAERRILAMAAKFGISQDEMAAHRDLALELTSNCGHCAEATACERAIKTGTPLPEDKCPNAPIYRALTEI